MFEAFVPAGAFATGKNLTQYDETNQQYMESAGREYTAGNKTRAQAIADFKRMVFETLDLPGN